MQKPHRFLTLHLYFGCLLHPQLTALAFHLILLLPHKFFCVRSCWLQLKILQDLIQPPRSSLFQTSSSLSFPSPNRFFIQLLSTLLTPNVSNLLTFILLPLFSLLFSSGQFSNMNISKCFQLHLHKNILDLSSLSNYILPSPPPF